MHFETVIGLEVHVELKTDSKIFSPSPAHFGAEPNTNTNVIDLGYPGVLPVVNKRAVEWGMKAAMALNMTVARESKFDRKNYFYPDNPKAYQISQFDQPIGENGWIDIEVNGETKRIGITRAHLEEDAGKLTHKNGYSLVDLNRQGTPLIEIVSEPDIRTPEEAYAYLEKLRSIIQYIEVSDVKMEEGSMRADANVSIRKEGTEKLGTKVEIKNIGSISNVGLSIQKEIERQKKIYDNNETIIPQTRRFDDRLNDTVLMRLKETGNDYRYFPEPNIPFINLTDEYIDKVLKTIPLLPDERRKLYKEKNISESNITKLIQNRNLSDYFNELLKLDTSYQTASNLLLGDISAYLNKEEKSITETKLRVEKLKELTDMIENKELTSKNVKDILNMVMEEDLTVEEIVKKAGIENISDENFIIETVRNVIKENEESVNDYKEGHDRAIKYLMGQVMKLSQGKINPQKAMELLKQELDN